MPDPCKHKYRLSQRDKTWLKTNLNITPYECARCEQLNDPKQKLRLRLEEKPEEPLWGNDAKD